MSQRHRLVVGPLLVFLTLTPSCKTTSPAEEYIADARKAAQAERYDQAETLADRAIEHGAQKRDPRLKQIRAAILRSKSQGAAESGDYQEAVSLLEQAAELETSDARLAEDYLRLAQLGLKLERPPTEIAQRCEEAIELNPALRPAYRLAGRMWDRAGKPHRAIDHYLWAFEADRSDTRIGFRLGSLYRQTDQPWDAIAIFERLLKHAPDHVQARVNLAELYESVGQTRSAREQFETLIDKHPDSAGILRRYAKFLDRQGDTERAREILRRAREAMPGVQRREMRQLE